MEEVDLAIAIFHYPSSWLAEFDAAAVAPRLNKVFDLHAFGHVHATEPELKTTVNGSALISQSGSMYAGRDYYNGYQIIDVDADICHAQVRLRTYFDKPTRRFGPAENIVAEGKAEFSYQPARGQHSPEIERALRELRPEIRRLALDQFNISDLGAELCSDPHTAFICPPIYTNEHEDSVSTDDEDDPQS